MNRQDVASSQEFAKLAIPIAFNPKHIDFVSKRVGNFTFSKQFYWLVAKSWVQ